MATLAASQALPFFIKVLDPPLSEQMLVNGMDNGVVKLQARSLPYRPITFEGRQRVKTTWYAGNTVATQQVMGPTEEPTVINGMWKDRFLGDGQARAMASLFDDIRRSGSRVEVTWGDGVIDRQVFGQSIVRRGIIARTKFTFERPQDIAWEIEFVWAGQGETTAPVVSATGIGNPREGLAALAESLADADDKLDALLEDPKTAALFGIPDQIQSQIDQDLEAIEILTDILGNRALTATAIAETPTAAVERAIEVGNGITERMRDVRDAILNIDDPTQVNRDDPVDLLDWKTNKFGVMQSLDVAQEQSMETATELTGQLFPEVIAEERPPAGTDLRDLARRYYGNGDLWFIIAQYNGIVGSKVPVLPSGPSDNPGRPIAIPRRQTGTLGDLRRAC